MNWSQRIKINGSFSDRTDIEFGVPQGSILGPMLLNINMIDYFYECEDSSVVNVIRKTQNINESSYRILIQLLSLDMDASF